MSSPAAQKQDVEGPLPFAQFKRFLAIFHVVFLAGLALSLVLRWRRPELVWGWKDTALVLLVLLQTVLYVLFFVLLLKPPSAQRWWLAYFAASFVIWLLEWQIEPGLEWTAWAYLGQLFGVLPPSRSVTMALAVFVTWFAVRYGTRGPSFWESVGVLSIAVSTTALGLFLHRLTATSVERGKLIKELEAARKQLEAARERDAELAALQERERLARDLHDSLGHGLVTLTVQLEAAQRLYPVDPQKAGELLEEMKQLTRTCMEHLRRSLSGLRAPGLEERQLSTALRQLCDESSREGDMQVECRLDGDADALPPRVADALWRVAQEALHNTIKHARASHAEVDVALRNGQATLTVTDDGTGLPPPPYERPGHFGLRGLRERMEGVGGRLRITDHPPSGTRIEASVPISVTT